MIKTALRKVLIMISASLAILWIYQGLVPKIIYRVKEEQIFWDFLGTPESYIFIMIQLSGVVEIIFGTMFIFFYQSKMMHYLNIMAMAIFCVVVLLLYPHFFGAAFNPFVMNVAMATLSVIALNIISLHNLLVDSKEKE